MPIKACLIVLIIHFAISLSAQDTHRLNGYVVDAETGEALIGASVLLPASQSGAYSNEYGYFSLEFPAADSLEVRVTYVGYEMNALQLAGTADLRMNVELVPAGKQLEDVVITSNSLEKKLNSSQMSMDQLSMVDAKKIPALFGEVDIIKTLQLKPGVQSGGEGTSGLYVRGGGPDQNLVLLDEAQVYNPSHLFGLFSTFNSDAVKDVRLFKGGFPAEYGGKLSSVIDVRLKEGNKKRFSTSGGLGLISSRLTLEGPIVKNKASFIFSGRRTYFDVFTRLLNQVNETNPNWVPIPDYYFYDLNGKVNVSLSDKDQLFLSAYGGRDVFGFESGNFGVDFTWGNKSATARWTHIFSPKLFLKTSGTYSDYNYRVENRFGQFDFNIGSGIRDVTGKTELLWLPGRRHEIKVGANYIYHTFSISRLEASSDDNTVNFSSGSTFYGHEMGVYINEEFRVNSRLTLNGGLRHSAFLSGEQWYSGIEPRASVKYSLNGNVSLKGSYTRMFQYVHLVANSGASLPTDIWYPSNSVVNPQQGDQVALGVSVLLGDDFLLTNEAYYKWLDRQVDFRDGAQIFFNPNLDEEFVFGKGWGYGNEIYLEKSRGKGNGFFDRMSGWVGYTLSWSWREFPDINEGRPFHPRYDRRHDVSVVLIQELSKRLTATATWVFGTGQAVSLPIARFQTQGPVGGTNPNVIPIYLDRNSFRMAPYHRMDLGLVWKLLTKRGESDLTLSIYNAYSRRNPYFIYFDTVRGNTTGSIRFAPKQVSLFPMIPSLTWNFKF